VAANYRAARRGESHRDFAAKVGTVIEEADESLFWLELLERSDISTADETSEVQAEANELVAIFTTCQKTARAK